MIDKISIRKLRKRVTEAKNFRTSKLLPKLSDDFDLNNNRTKESLNSVTVRGFSTMETSLIATSGSSVLLLLVAMAVIIGYNCIKRNNDSEKLVVVVDKTDKEKGNEAADVNEGPSINESTNSADRKKLMNFAKESWREAES